MTDPVLEQRLEENTGYVHNQAFKFVQAFGCPWLFDDFVQEGRLGIVDAHARFDNRPGVKFLSLAQFLIRGRMIRYATENSRAIRLPLKSFFRHPVSQVSLEAPASDGGNYPNGGFDGWTGGFDGRTLAEVIPADGPEVFDEDTVEAVRQAIARLPLKERQAVEDRFYHRMTLAQSGRRHGVSREAIRQRISTALVRLGEIMKNTWLVTA